MPLVPHPVDWQQLLRSRRAPLPLVDCKRRLRWMLAGFVLAVAVVLARAAWLEVTRGPAARHLASQPLEQDAPLPAPRGRILARDGTVLAGDRPAAALSMHYRYLEEPANARWLRQQARQRLSPRERRQAENVTTEIDRLRVERAELHRRLARLCGVSLDEWNEARSRVQQRVERIARAVNARSLRRASHRSAEEPTLPDDASWTAWLRRALSDALSDDDAPPSSASVTVAEELAYHVVMPTLPAEAATQIEMKEQLYPGVRIVHRTVRTYPQGQLAAHVLGHVGKLSADELQRLDGKPSDDHQDAWVGRMGLELACEARLRGTPGVERRRLDRRRQVLGSRVVRSPVAGGDLILTIDPQLQRWAERLLDGALLSQTLRDGSNQSAGAALVALDCRDGQVLVCAAAPRFDPGDLVSGRDEAISALLEDPAAPLFDRAVKMALPPGSVMKTITAAALLEEHVVAPAEAFFCQGYLRSPAEHRCAIYVDFGLGHGEVTLTDALAQSCNVYFFHHALRLGPRPLVAWAQRLGLGQPTGIDLPDESAGLLPSEDDLAGWHSSDTLALAIGQGTVTATPLQIARLMALLAGDGHPVVPHVIDGAAKKQRVASSEPDGASPLSPATLKAIRAGMRQAVDDPTGTAHSALAGLPFSVAAKTGTAETGGGKPSHAWIAGYAPAENPRIAFAIAVEHGGSGAIVAGPLAQRLLQQMHEAGWLR